MSNIPKRYLNDVLGLYCLEFGAILRRPVVRGSILSRLFLASFFYLFSDCGGVPTTYSTRHLHFPRLVPPRVRVVLRGRFLWAGLGGHPLLLGLVEPLVAGSRVCVDCGVLHHVSDGRKDDRD